MADIMPTFAELAGQPAPIGIDGRSMLSDLLTGTPSKRPDAFGTWQPQQFGANNPASWEIRVGDWKLIKYFPTSIPGSTIFYRLHNLAADPSETTDLYASRPDIANAMQTIAFDEGFDRESFAPTPNNPSVPLLVNNYFSQYKTWAPQSGSTDFFAAANWQGGTQVGFPGDPDAQNWNTGPADNWIATMSNAGAQAQQIVLNANANLLGLELRGPGAVMQVTVPAGRKLTASKGARLSAGGVIELDGGDLVTVRDVDIRPGGLLRGEGLITGRQQVIAGIPEFANKGLFEPTVVNAGEFSVGSAAAGIVTIQGDFNQSATGELDMELFGSGSTPGVHFDKLAISGTAELGGVLKVGISGSWAPQLGDMFQVLSAGTLIGMFDQVLVPSLFEKSWLVRYVGNAVTLEVVAAQSADFNHDGFVDGGDLDVWQQNFGPSAGADANGDGVTDGADYLVWQKQLGTQMGSMQAAGAVPEPASFILLGLAAVAGGMFRHRSWRRVSPREAA
jgi:hypothetical protein